MPRTRIKLCGMMSPAHARMAADLGADAVGMILHADTRRRIDPVTARAIVATLPPYVATVGVFVDALPAQVIDAAAHLQLSAVQFHGNETIGDVAAVAPHKVIKAIKVDPTYIRTLLDEWREAYADGRCANLSALLLETPAIGQSGGTGIANDFPLIHKLHEEGAFKDLPPIVVSGGLTPENVENVVRLLRPYAVDVSSGIESSPGQKSAEKMEAFVQAVACADNG